MPAANRYTTTELLTSIRRLAHVPASQTPYQDSDLLAIADEECQTVLMKQILSVRENYYLTYTDFSVNATGIYYIPSRATGGALADVHIVVGTTVIQVTRTEIGEQFSTISSPTGMYSFTLQGNYIVVSPVPSSGVVRLWFYSAPNTLIATSSAAQVTSIASNVLSFSTIPSTITTATPCDLIGDQPLFDWLAIDQTPTAVTSSTITFTSVPSRMSVGDWVSLAGQTPVPQIPVGFRPLLARRVQVIVLEIQGYLDKMKAAQSKVEEMEKAVLDLINPRVSEEPKIIGPDPNIIGGYGRFRTWSAS